MTRYVCSECGYSRDTVEPVVDHIADSHPGSARVMTYEEEPQPPLHVRLVALVRQWWGNK